MKPRDGDMESEMEENAGEREKCAVPACVYTYIFVIIITIRAR